MIGTTRSRVSFFMNRFRKLGFIEYNGRIRVHKSLLNVVLHDQLPEHNAVSASISISKKDRTKQIGQKKVIVSKTAQNM
jgi:CRP/FNR family cyclic AMP-dependent transcriptional regulator